MVVAAFSQLSGPAKNEATPVPLWPRPKYLSCVCQSRGRSGAATRLFEPLFLLTPPKTATERGLREGALRCVRTVARANNVNRVNT
jgi:hypothetical protein